jgi:hypothetical protein
VVDQVEKKEGNIEIEYCPTGETDYIITKPLSGALFLKFKKMIIGM